MVVALLWADGGVAEQFLWDFDVGTHPTQQARVGMPKRVPANLVDRHARLQVDVLSQNALLPVWLPLKVTDEFLPTTTGSLVCNLRQHCYRLSKTRHCFGLPVCLKSSRVTLGF